MNQGFVQYRPFFSLSLSLFEFRSSSQVALSKRTEVVPYRQDFIPLSEAS